MGLPKLWGKDKSGSQGFVFSHVKTIYYNWASKILLKTKLDEMDALIDAKIAKAMMSNQQVNDANKVPTSALVYGMGQNITENANDIAEINGSIIPEYFKNTIYSNVSKDEDTKVAIENIFMECQDATRYNIILRPQGRSSSSVDIYRAGVNLGVARVRNHSGEDYVGIKNGTVWNWDSYALKSDLVPTMKPMGDANLNANNIKNTGIYSVPQSLNAENYPNDDGNGVLIVFSANQNANMVVQMFFDFNGTGWCRTFWYGTWRSWTGISNSLIGT